MSLAHYSINSHFHDINNENDKSLMMIIQQF